MSNSDSILKKILNVERSELETWEVTRIGSRITIKYGEMYEPPVLNFSTLMELSEYFGTQEIDVDKYSVGGCESCDFGSDYGHEITIRNATRNLDEPTHVDANPQSPENGDG